MRVIALYGPYDCGKSTMLEKELSKRYLRKQVSFRSPSPLCMTEGVYGELSVPMKPGVVKRIAIWPDGDSSWLVDEGFLALDRLRASGVVIDAFIIASRDRLKGIVRENCSSRGLDLCFLRKGKFEDEAFIYPKAVLDALYDSINNRDLESLIDAIFM